MEHKSTKRYWFILTSLGLGLGIILCVGWVTGPNCPPCYRVAAGNIGALLDVARDDDKWLSIQFNEGIPWMLLIHEGPHVRVRVRLDSIVLQSFAPNPPAD